MSVSDQMLQISGLLVDIVRDRWVDDDILEHVEVRLPAPVFDRLSMDLKRDLCLVSGPPDFRSGGGYFECGGIKYRRIDGQYWSVGEGK